MMQNSPTLSKCSVAKFHQFFDGSIKKVCACSHSAPPIRPQHICMLPLCPEVLLMELGLGGTLSDYIHKVRTQFMLYKHTA